MKKLLLISLFLLLTQNSFAINISNIDFKELAIETMQIKNPSERLKTIKNIMKTEFFDKTPVSKIKYLREVISLQIKLNKKEIKINELKINKGQADDILSWNNFVTKTDLEIFTEIIASYNNYWAVDEYKSGQWTVSYIPTEEDKNTLENIYKIVDKIVIKNMDKLSPIQKELQKMTMNKEIKISKDYILYKLWVYIYNKLTHLPTLEKYSENYIKNVVEPREAEYRKRATGTFTASKWNWAVNWTYVKDKKIWNYINWDNVLKFYENKWWYLYHKNMIYYMNNNLSKTPPNTWWVCWLWYKKNLIFIENK